MKRALGFVVLIAMAVALCAGCQAEPEETVPYDVQVLLGATGASVTLPSDVGFEEHKSELNDFFGRGSSGEWCIIVNRSGKEGFTFEEYCSETARANNAAEVLKDEAGEPYFTYMEGGYRFYAAVREGKENYYCVVFYCFNEVWDYYQDDFAKWAATITVK